MKDTTVSCRGMNSRLGACVVLDIKSDELIYEFLEITLSPEDVDTLVKQLLAARNSAITRYGRVPGPPRKSALRQLA
jgi:hypothetical protein